MKAHGFGFVLFFAATVACAAPLPLTAAPEVFDPKGYDVYLLLGQSNMSGRGTLTADNELPSDGVVKFTKDMKWEPATEPLHFDGKRCGAGLAMSFARRMSASAPERTIALVPCAVGGTPLSRWCPGGDRKSTRLNSSHPTTSRMPSSA